MLLATCDGMERVDELNANIKGFWLNGLQDESGRLLLLNTSSLSDLALESSMVKRALQSHF